MEVDCSHTHIIYIHIYKCAYSFKKLTNFSTDRNVDEKNLVNHSLLVATKVTEVPFWKYSPRSPGFKGMHKTEHYLI